MRVEVVHTGGLYAERVIAYLSSRPGSQVTGYQVPRDLPLIVDEPEEFLPADLGAGEVLIALHLHQDLLVELPRKIHGAARALIAPIEDPSWVKAGLQRQLTQTCAQYGIETAFPKPFCALTPSTPAIQAFCDQYGIGLPRFRITVEHGLVASVEVLRAAPCSITTFIAGKLVGLPADDTLPERAGYLHHAYPCLATMNLDPETGDTVMHKSLHLLREQVAEALRRAKA